jgi:hypothetical protein
MQTIRPADKIVFECTSIFRKKGRRPMKTIILLLLLSTSGALGQQQPTPLTCPATEKAILDLYQVQHQASLRNDFATVARIIDDQAILNYDDGKRRSKDETVASTKQQQSGWETVDEGPMEDTVVKFEDGVAILTFARGGRSRNRNSDFTITGSARESYIYGCRGSEWKVIFRAETQIPNAHRAPDISVLSHLDDYVGHYRFYQNGDKGDFRVFHKGDKLFESTGPNEADELLPGRFDTFFVRNDGQVERFLRDKNGRVVGIYYVFGDSDLEARRVGD